VCARCGRVDAQAFARLATKQHVLPDAKASDEFEMLVNEPDRSVCADASGIGTRRSERDVRERRFAGAVFADESVNFAGKKIEFDAVDGDDPRIRFNDAAQAERGCDGYSFAGFQLESSSRVDGTLTRPLIIAC